MVKWKRYETEKKKLIEKNLDFEEYEKEVKNLIKKYRL